ncbi:unnamed protein product [Tilletia controversa]|uniref:Endopeptidase S2P n=1 Tax=Tilletia controversa TaxID=13291 RepID=A0A8X7MZK8_9BASI|nr:hypothetical protein CF328_g4700 [Tilletia controversa]KAE8255856.1 hypothetical protein A4X06_0g209 [Tilletia controversa]CAD6940851.1 unnamed protein product [Tilletia controversa]
MLELSRHAVTLSTDRFNSYPHKFWVYLGILSARTSSTGASSSSSTIPHDSDRSQRKNTKRRARAVGKFYDAGIVFGVLATLVSISLVILAGFQLILRVLELEGELERAFLTGNDGGSLSGAIIDGIPKDGIVANALQRRDGGPMLDVPLPLDSSSRSGGPVFPGKAEDSSGPLLTPLIPGITIPLWHIVPMLIALLICQVIHESGHALAAALSHIPPLSSGLAIMLPCMPSAFVAFPSSALAIFASDLDVGGNGTGVGKDDEERSESRGGDEVGGRILPLAEQLRIVTAGVWHNAVSVLVFLVAKVFMSGWAPASDAVAQSSIFEPFALILDYVYTISIALAVLNMLPLWDFDGEAFVERLALLLMRRRSGEQRGVASSAPMGPWNGYVGTSAAEMGRHGATGRLGKRLLDQQNGSPQRSNGGAGNGTAGLQFFWPLSSIALTKSEQEGPSVRGRTFQVSGRGDDADLESGGGGESSGSIGRFSMTGSSAAGPTTVPNLNGVEGPQIRSDSILASPEETKVLRALRTRLRSVFGLTAVAVFGGTVVLEIVLAFQ